MVWITKNGKRIWVEYRVVNGRRYRIYKHKGMRNRRTKEFHRYGDSSIHLNPGHNAGKPFRG